MKTVQVVLYCITKNAECVSSYHVQNSWTPPKTGPPKGGGVAESSHGEHICFLWSRTPGDKQYIDQKTLLWQAGSIDMLVCTEHQSLNNNSTAVIAEEQYYSQKKRTENTA